MRHGITHAALRDFARLHRATGQDIDVDPRALLHTRKKRVGDAQFVHLGLTDGLKRKLDKGIHQVVVINTSPFQYQSNIVPRAIFKKDLHFYTFKSMYAQVNDHPTLLLQVNTDGLPIYKTNTKEMWSILVRVLNGKDSRPFVVSVYMGKGKPNSVESFCRPFLDEIKILMSNGITVEDRHYRVKIANIPCDAPARQFLKCIAGHCGREACERCTQEGVRLSGKLVGIP